MTPLRLGIVGVGKHGSRYAKHAAEDLPDTRLVAVCRRDELRGQEVAERYGCEYVSDALRLLERPDIDAVVVATVPALLVGNSSPRPSLTESESWWGNQ